MQAHIHFYFFTLIVSMNIKKLIAGGLLTVIATASAVATTVSFASSEKTVAQTVVEFVVPSADALSSTGGVVTIESSDLANVDTSVNNLLATVFEVLKLLPYLALIIGGFYLLDRLFGILPRPGSGK